MALLPQTTPASAAPANEPANWAAAYGSTARPGKARINNSAIETVGLRWAPLRLPHRLRMSESSVTPTASPTTARARWMSVIAIGEVGLVSQRTALTTTNNNTVVSANSYSAYTGLTTGRLSALP